MASIELPHDFEPRWYQRPFMLHFIGDGHDGSGRRAAWVVHRRGGKDLTGMHTLNVCAHRRRGAYWHTFPTFEQGRKAIWEGFTKEGKRILDNVFPEPLIRRKDNQQMVVELKCGSIYRVIGTDKIEMVGAGPVGVLHSEYSIAKPKAADLIAPMLRENNGWEAYVFTPRGSNHGRKKYEAFQRIAKEGNKDFFAQLLTLEDTRAYDPEATLAAERAAGRPEALIRQEYLCDWTAANVGSVWGDLVESLERSQAIGAFEHGGNEVFTSWDLGHTDATAIWFWRLHGGSVEVIDHYEAHGKPMSHYFDVVDAKPYSYRMHWLPHDARAKTLQTGSSILEQSLAHWPKQVGVVPNLSLADGIQAGRWLLQQGIRIHSRCEAGIEALRQYHYEYDEDTKAFGLKPEHDWSSHCFAGDTLVLTRNGTQRIMDLPFNGEVLTPCGWKPYRNPRIAKRNAPLVEVAFADGSTVKCTPDHLFLTVSGWRSAEHLLPGSLIQSSLTQSHSCSTDASGACFHLARITERGRGLSARWAAALTRFIAMCGGSLSAPYRMAATFITVTRTWPTTGSPIWNACQLATIGGIPLLAASPRGHTRAQDHGPESRLPLGIGAKPGDFGTVNTRDAVRVGQNGSAPRSRARCAANSFSCWSVLRAASKSIAARLAKLRPTGADIRAITVLQVRRLDETADVWDLTVPETECFSLANGAVVHNSADAFRYLAVIAKYAGVISRKEAPKAPLKVPPLSEAITVDRLFEKEEVLARRKRI